jgi:hypothetical protein
MTPEEEIQRADEAARIMGSALYQEAMRKLKQTVIDQWGAAPARDTEGREWLWQHYQVTLKFEELLTEILNTGKLSRALERERSIGERVRQAFR